MEFYVAFKFLTRFLQKHHFNIILEAEQLKIVLWLEPSKTEVEYCPSDYH